MNDRRYDPGFDVKPFSRQNSNDDDDESAAPPPVWLVADTTPLRSENPCLRAGHSIAAFSNRLYLFGGYCDYASYVASNPPNVEQLLRGARPGIGLHFNSLHEFSVDTGEWRVLHPGCHPHEARAQALPKPRRHASLVVHGGSLFIYGGFDVDGKALPDLWEYKIETNSWHLIPGHSSSPFGYNMPDPATVLRRGQVPVARAEHTAIVQGNRMIIFGGYDGKRKLNDTYVYDFAIKQWSRPSHAEHNAPSRRCKHSAILYKSKMYIVGGFQYKDGYNYAWTDMHSLDLDTFVWSTILMGDATPEALQGHKAVVCGDSMYIIGGKVRSRSRNSLPASANLPSSMASSLYPCPNDMTTSSAGMPAYSSQPATPNVSYPSPSPTSDSRSTGLNNAVFRYVFDANRWTILETSGEPPSPRQLHAATAIPTSGGRCSIFLFGGTDRSKQRFFQDLCELRGIRSPVEVVKQPCETCASTKMLLDNQMFSDIRFIVEEKPIYAHRCILYARAEYFRNMFDSQMRETLEMDIPIPDVSYTVFRAVLEYIYSGGAKVTNGRMAIDLLKAADMFQIEGLRNLCVEKVEQAVTIENVAFVCQVADTHNAQSLKLFCITFMMQNFRDVIKSESFQTLMRQDPGGLGHEILESYSDSSPYSSGTKRARK